ncbi:unnamed protein product, partial [Urochloa humidicola]
GPPPLSLLHTPRAADRAWRAKVHQAPAARAMDPRRNGSRLTGRTHVGRLSSRRRPRPLRRLAAEREAVEHPLGLHVRRRHPVAALRATPGCLLLPSTFYSFSHSIASAPRHRSEAKKVTWRNRCCHFGET